MAILPPLTFTQKLPTKIQHLKARESVLIIGCKFILPQNKSAPEAVVGFRKEALGIMGAVVDATAG